MKKIFMLVIILTTMLFGQYDPYTTTGWDDPYSFTGDSLSSPLWSSSNGYYGLGIMRIDSNPGGWLNYNYWKIDSLLQALVVYTDSSQIIVRNDTLMLSESAAAKLDTGFISTLGGIGSFTDSSAYDTVIVTGLDTLDYAIVTVRDSIPEVQDMIYVVLKPDTLIVCRNNGGSDSSSVFGLKYNWIWLRQ